MKSQAKLTAWIYITAHFDKAAFYPAAELNVDCHPSDAQARFADVASGDRREWNKRRLERMLLKTATLGSTVLAALLWWAASQPALGNLFVALPAGPSSPGVIGEYTNSGETVNASLITELVGPGPIAVSDGFIYVIDRAAGTIGKYTTSGATIDPALITGLNDPQDVEVSGGDLYVSQFGSGLNGGVAKYTTSGEAVNTSLIPGLQYGRGLAVLGTNLFVGTSFDTLGEYKTSGETVNASLITG